MIKDSTYSKSGRPFLTQTPDDMDKKNYWIKELQDKVDRDWYYRPNRADIEQETQFGSEEYFPLEVVLQSVRSDSGEKVSDDWRRIVFRDIRYKTKIGQRYRFRSDFETDVEDDEKSIWIAVNQDNVSATSQQVVVRCNGTLGSIYVDDDGNKRYHYEPVSQKEALTGTNPNMSQIAIDPRGSITITAQHNKYTKQYYINQRFIIGYDQVYKVKNIIKTGSLTTYNPNDVGIMTIYLDMDQSGALDDFENRIAYNGRREEELPKETPVEDGYSIKITSPSPCPEELTSEKVFFSVYLQKNGVNQPNPISVSAHIENVVSPQTYFTLLVQDGNHFRLHRNKFFGGGNLFVKCFIPQDQSPTGQEISTTFQMSLKSLE